MQPRLSPTSFAILGLLAIRPWSTYELTKQMRRAFVGVWPRAESNLYREPQRLVDAGLAVAERHFVGRRARTEYSITEAGREALRAWLEEPSSPTRLESEAMLKVLFGDSLAPESLIRHLEAFAAEAEATDMPWRSIAREYVDGMGPFPQRAHVNALYWVMLDQWARLRADWARWAAAEVAAWPDGHGPSDRTQVSAMLERALGDDQDFLRRRPRADRSPTLRPDD